ncbi:MAG: GNAT family N-acetyltransferase [Chloroflexi bacterium]|nr:GNAT family N-acetyltransferase [Chloroflexota bacterium]
MSAYEERLAPDLVLRTVRDERDVDRFAAFNTAINDATQGATCANLLRHHPEIQYDDFMFVEDERTGEVVSTICLIPWRCVYEDIMLDVAMLEMVVTHPDYRHRGLVRTQIGRFHQVVNERRFDLSIIEGIPYYYRQYGYAYATDHARSDSLPAWQIPAPPKDHVSPYQLRPATLADLPVLTELYQQNIATLGLATLRSSDYWQFLLQWAQYPVQIVEEIRTHTVAGYVASLVNKRGIKVLESSLPDYAAGLAVLQQFKEAAHGEIQLGWPQTSPLVQVGRSLGSVPMPGDQWLLRIRDVASFLTKIGPVLERRVATTPCAGLTIDLCINLFRQAFVLHFVDGKLRNVTAAGFVDASMGADGGDLCIPPDAFVRLVCGYRSVEELCDAWPDIVVKPASRYILEALFPKRLAYLSMPYLYCG